MLVVLGDHQPATIVTGESADHDVPISIIAHDPAVLDQISGWGWQDGLRPEPAGAGLADGRLPRPLPRRLRSDTGDLGPIVTAPLPTAAVAVPAPAALEQLPVATPVPGLPMPRRGGWSAWTASAGWPRCTWSCNHVFLRAFPGYPADQAPFWAAGFIYGRFAVVVFIVLSGFSLARRRRPAPAGGWTGCPRFARRRAWRILPPYWAALVFSLLMTWFVLPSRAGRCPARSRSLVNGLLVQDIVAAPSPNRAFWSIAIEAQLYVVFPLLILMVPPARRGRHGRRGRRSVVVTLGRAGRARRDGRTLREPVHARSRRAVRDRRRCRRHRRARARRRRSWPWHWLALAAAAPVVALIGWQGSVWTIDNLFWVDLALGPAIGCLLAAVATGRPGPLVRLLDTRPLRRLGSFSYSLYLTHAPIVIAVYYGSWPAGSATGVPLSSSRSPSSCR